MFYDGVDLQLVIGYRAHMSIFFTQSTVSAKVTLESYSLRVSDHPWSLEHVWDHLQTSSEFLNLSHHIV